MSRRMARGGRFALITLVLLAAACPGDEARNTLRVDLRTDFVPRVEFDVVRLQIGDGDLAEEVVLLVRDGTDFLRGARLGEAQVQPGPMPLTVTLYRAGDPIAMRRVTATVQNSITVVTVVMTRSCEGVACPNSNPLFESCLGGRCVDPRCTVETPEFCPDAMCAEDLECEVVECAMPRCQDGVCLSIPNDSRCAEGERCDGILGCVMSGTIRDSGVDAEPFDAGTGGGADASMDAGVDAADASDAAADAGNDAGPPRACPIVDGDTVFLFDFESENDLAGGAGGISDGSLLSAGDSPCGGNAVSFPVRGVGVPSHFRVENRASFELPEGSLDFWVKMPAVTNQEVVLGREAAGQDTPGHLSVFWTPANELYVRIQDVGPTNPNGMACSNALTPDTWHRIGVHFGPGGLELFVDGILNERGGPHILSNPEPCGTDLATGITGNTNPFVIGANSFNSGEGTHLPLTEPFSEVIVDHFRLSSVLRAYEDEVYP